MKAYLKRNKPLLFLPLVLIPFIVLIFYVLGGGKNTKDQTQNPIKQDSVKGANYNLPEADRSIEIRDKTENSFSSDEIVPSHDYNILEEGIANETINENDPVAVINPEEPEPVEMNEAFPETTGPGINPGDPEDLLKHIRRREQQIRNELTENKTGTDKLKNTVSATKAVRKPVENTKPEIPDKSSMQNLPVTGIEELDKVFQQNRELARKNDSLSLHLREVKTINEKLDAKRNKHFVLEKGIRSGFRPEETSNSLLKAEVYETTTVLTGNRVKLRMLEDGWLNGNKITTGTFLYGICELSNERLQITVRQIPVGENFIPVDITIHDMDGLPGLYVPDNASRKVAKEVGGSANTSSMFGMTDNPLTYAGIQAADRTAQSLLKMIRLKKVTVKKNTQVYLINKTK